MDHGIRADGKDADEAQMLLNHKKAIAFWSSKRKTSGSIDDAFEQSFFVMVHLPYLQPFADVNKRTSRLAANIPLIGQNLCPLSFVGVPERAYVEGILAVYEFNRVDLLRDVYAWAYERSCAQYRVVRDSVIQPDPIRLRFREQLIELVHDFVVDGVGG